MDITWFPNSWIRLRTRKKVMYFDPAYMATNFRTFKDKTEFSRWPDPIDGLPNGLEKADYIFITHHHKDHCKRVTITRLLKSGTRVFAPHSCHDELGQSYQLVEPGNTFLLEKGIVLTVVDAYNMDSGSSTRKQHKKGIGVGYILTIDNYSIYHLGDTDLIPEMDSVRDVNLAFVPIGGKFTMDMDEAIRTTLKVHPRVVMPIHTLEADPDTFREKVGAVANDIRCIIPAMGEVITLQGPA